VAIIAEYDVVNYNVMQSCVGICGAHS